MVMNSYTAEFGRNTGPQINVVTKSGGQRYSGSLSTYIRHEALNSNTLANERLGLPKPIARYYTGVGHDRRAGGAARRREAQADLLLLHARDVEHEAGGDPEHQADADRGGTQRRFLADDADQRHAVLHPRPAAERRLQSDRGRPGVLPGQRDSRRSHRPARPRLREPVPDSELLRHQRQQPAVQLRRYRRPEGVPVARSGDASITTSPTTIASRSSTGTGGRIARRRPGRSASTPTGTISAANTRRRRTRSPSTTPG